MGEFTLMKRNGESIPLLSKEPFCVVKSAQQSQTLMGDDTVTLNIISTQVIDFAKGDKIIVGGEEYSIRTAVSREKISDTHYSYEAVFYGVMYELMKSLYRNAYLDTNGHVKSDKSVFDLTYTLKDFVKVLIYNLDRDYPALWTFDEENCPDTETVTLSFSRQNCLQVLQTLCNKDNFNYDFKITQNNGVRTIHIGRFGQKVAPPGGGEFFEWGKGNGLYKLKEEKVDDKGIKTRLWVEGGSQNIRSSYRDYAGALQLPFPQRLNKHDHTLRDGTVIKAGTEMIGISDDTKRYFEDADLANALGTDEDAVVYDNIHPTRTGEVTAMAYKKGRYNNDTSEIDYYAFIDSTMNFDLNKKTDGSTDYLIDGNSAKITFITGRLAGQQFEVEKYDTDGKRFKLIPFTDSRGLTLPMEGENAAFRIEVGNKYKITDINLPSEYEEDAEEELWYEGLQDFNDMRQARVKYSLTFDRMYFLENSPRDSHSVIFNVGDYVPVKDERFGVEKSIRITQINRNLLLEQDYNLTLSDTHTVSVATQAVINVQEHEKIVTTYGLKDLTKAKRGWRTTEELRSMIYDTDGYFDMENIRPLSIDTNMLTVGSKSQQFVLTNAILEANYGGRPNTFNASRALLSHLTIQENGIKHWEIAASMIELEDNDGYYLFARCPKDGSDGIWYMTKEQLLVENDSDPNNYYFQVGILSSVYDDGFRDFVTTYGFTRINGNTITTGKIVTSDGGSYLDLDGNRFRMGDSQSSIDYNVTADKQVTLKNVKLLSTSGDTSDIGVYRGTYNSNYIYYRGDEVSYTVNGETCTYRYKNANPNSGIAPTNSVYWDVLAKGAKGEQGNSIFYTYHDSLAKPTKLPTGGGTNDGWHTESTDAVVWMSIKTAKDITSGSWGTPFKVKGADGTSVAIKGSVSSVSQLPSAGNTQGDSYLIDGNLYVWDGTSWQNMGRIKGDDGKSSYLHMKYSDDGGTTFTAGNGETPGRWVGMYVDQSVTDPDTPSCYTWRDGKGEQGIPGENGKDGKTSYLHIKYSDDGGLSFTGHNGKDSGVWIGVYTDFEEMDSSDPTKYTWSKVTGTGAAGADSEVGTYYEYRYAKNGSTTQSPTLNKNDSDPSGWSREMPTVGLLEYIWCTMCIKSALGDRSIFHIPVRSGAYLTDFSGNGYNGRLGGGSIYIDSHGESLMLSDENESLIPCGLPFGESFTLCFWMKLTKAGAKWIVTSENGRESVENDLGVTINAWHHYAFRFNDKTCTLFVDGEQKQIAVMNCDLAGFSIYDDNLFGSTFFIDEVRLVRGALALADINSVRDGKADALIQAWCEPFRVNPYDGKDAVSVETVDVEYAISTSNTQAPTSGWKADAPDWVDGKYIWSRTKVTYTDGDSTTSDPVCITGGKGGTGRGVSSIVEQYYLSSSNKTPTNGSWSPDYSGWKDGWYIWTRSVITYTDSSTPTYTTPICVTGGKGATGDDGKSAKYIYLKGTGRNRESNSEVEIFDGKDSTVINSVGRGLRLVTVNRDTLAVVDNIVYDVYSSNSAYGDSTERTALANKINGLTDSVFICLVSYDAVGWSEALVNALMACGSWGVDNVATGRYPFAFIGMKGMAKGNAIQIQSTAADDAPYAEISTYVARDMFATSNSGDNKIGPASPFRGVYDATKTYYGTHTRVDVVKYNGVYYVARADAGAFNNVAPPNPSKWNTFGAQFDSVATELLLAELANIAGFIFRNNRMESQYLADGTTTSGATNKTPMLFLDGVKGEASFAGGKAVFNADGSVNINNKFVLKTNGDAELQNVTMRNAKMQDITAKNGIFEGIINASNGFTMGVDLFFDEEHTISGTCGLAIISSDKAWDNVYLPSEANVGQQIVIYNGSSKYKHLIPTGEYAQIINNGSREAVFDIKPGHVLTLIHFGDYWFVVSCT